MLLNLSRLRAASYVAALLALLCLGLIGCKASVEAKKYDRLLTTPYQLLEHRQDTTKTLYTFSIYREGMSTLTVVRDRDGRLLVGLLIDSEEAYLVLPGTLPIRLQDEYIDIVEKELFDVWSGDQLRLSYVSLYDDKFR